VPSLPPARRESSSTLPSARPPGPAHAIDISRGAHCTPSPRRAPHAPKNDAHQRSRCAMPPRDRALRAAGQTSVLGAARSTVGSARTLQRGANAFATRSERGPQVSVLAKQDGNTLRPYHTKASARARARARVRPSQSAAVASGGALRVRHSLRADACPPGSHSFRPVTHCGADGPPRNNAAPGAGLGDLARQLEARALQRLRVVGGADARRWRWHGVAWLCRRATISTCSPKERSLRRPCLRCTLHATHRTPLDTSRAWPLPRTDLTRHLPP
jgi:hypothetical protein